MIDIYTKIKELHEVLKKELPDNISSVKIYINCEGFAFSLNEVDPEYLKEQEITMRNVAGKIIKTETE